jgi:multiple sugar transport system permease protein
MAATRIDRERMGLWLMLVPFLAGVALLVVVPAAVTLVMSMFEWDLVRPARFLGLGNFRELLGDEAFRASLRNSLTYVAIAVPLRVAIAFGLALLMHRRMRGVGVERASVLFPTVIPDVAYALLWLWILNPLYGPLNLLLDGVGLPTPSWLTVPASARWGVILMGLFLIGEGFLIALAARRAVPGELYDMASASGAGPWARFTRVTLPLMTPALLLMATRDTILSFQATFVPALIVTDGGPPPYGTTYLPLFVYRNAFEYLRYGYASAATVWLFLLTASIVWLQYRAADRLRRGALWAGSGRDASLV